MFRNSIYRDRMKIEDFSVDDKNSINYDLFNALFDTKYILSSPRKGTDILAIFNDAYFICTKILIDKIPDFQVGIYQSLIDNSNTPPNKDRSVIVMSMVLVYLRMLDFITDDIDKTIKNLKDRVINYNVAEYNKIICVIGKGKTIKATNFLPLDYPDGDYSNYWKSYYSFLKDVEIIREGVLANEKSKGKAGDKEVSASYSLSRRSNILTSEDKINDIKRLQKECDEWKKKYEELINNKNEKAFNAQTESPCFTSRQMSILLTAVGRLTEKNNPPGKTTLGEIVEKISGYKSTTASTNMKGAIPSTDTETVAKAIESKFPNLAAEVRKL